MMLPVNVRRAALLAAWILQVDGMPSPTFARAPIAARASIEAPQSVHPYAAHVAEAAQRFNIPERWIWAVMNQESGGKSGAISRAGAMGLMQIMPATWSDLRARMGLGNDPYDPRNNILAGTAYLRAMHDRYGLSGMLAAYNAGPGRYEEYVFSGRPLPAETRAYLARLLPAITGTDEELATSQIAQLPPPWTQSALFPRRSVAAQSDGFTATSREAAVPPPDRNMSWSQDAQPLFIPRSGQAQ